MATMLVEEIYELFFAKLLEDDRFKKSFVKELRKIVESGKVDQTTIRKLIEAEYPHAD